MWTGGYGQDDAWDLLIDGLFSNKLSPIAGMVRDGLRGEMFGGEKFTIEKALLNLTTPLSIQNFEDLKDDPESSFILGSVILEGIGLSTSTYRYEADWSKSTGKELTQFREEVGERKFKEANADYNRAYANWYNIITRDPEYKKLSDKQRGDLISDAKKVIKVQIFKEYGFKYKSPRKTLEEKREEKRIEKLLPK